ncbi:MAG: hypothetical protein ACT4NP_19560 [Pseudonocardiales bacterium]
MKLFLACCPARSDDVECRHVGALGAPGSTIEDLTDRWPRHLPVEELQQVGIE